MGPLVDIASQHDQQSLTDPESQLAILDAFAENATLRSEMAAAYAAQAAAAAALAGFSADARARAEREDLLRFQLGELEAARPVPGEDQTLAAERERLRGAEKFYAATAGGEETLYAGDGAVERAGRAVLRDLAAAGGAGSGAGAAGGTVADAAAAIEDVARDLGRYARGVRSDPARLAEIEERLFLLSRLCRETRRHGRRPGRAARRARRGAGRGRRATTTRWRRARPRRDAGEHARRRGRRGAVGVAQAGGAQPGEEGVGATLRELGFATARLPVVLFEARELGPTGADRVRFLFAPNPGEAAAPAGEDRIGRRAVAGHAGGEAGARADGPGADLRVRRGRRGRGRRAAEVIGRKLKRIAADRQVIVITHLAQVAAFADAHVRVSKSVARGKTRVAIEPLSETDRAGRDRAHAGGRRAVAAGHRPRRRDAARRARRLTQPRPRPGRQRPGAKWEPS